MLAASSSCMLASYRPGAAAAPSLGLHACNNGFRRRHGAKVSCRATPEQQHSAAQRLYQQALADSLHDLSLDFDKTYLKCRCTTSVPVCMEEEEEPAAATWEDSSGDAAAAAQLAAAASQAQHLDCMMAGFQAFLQYQQLVSSSSTDSSSLLLPQPLEQQLQQQQGQLKHQHLEQSKIAGAGATISLGSSSSSSGSGGSSMDPASSIDLLHCAVLIARHAYPAADLDQIRAAVADLGARAAALAAATSSNSSSSSSSRARALAAAVSHVLYEVEGFQGAVDDYYSPDSQCINKLLETKQGSPALLALLHKSVAAAASLELTAVTLPGHTFVQPLSHMQNSSSGSSSSSSAVEWSASPYLIDPFNAGQVCSSSVVEARLSACWGYPGHTLCLNADHVTLSRDAGSGSSSSSADISWRGDRALLVRLLKNLRESYYGPLPLSGRIRWAMHLRHTGAGSSSSSSSAAASEAAAVLDKLIAAAAAAASITSSLGSSSSSSGDADSEAVAATPGGRELLTGALAVVRYHRATAPHEVRLVRDEGYILHLLGRSSEGSALLQQYLAAAPAAADMPRVQEFVVADRAAPPEE